MSKARDSIEDLKTIDANLAAKASNTALAAKAPIASPTFTGTIAVGTGAISSIDNNSIVVGSGATNLRMIATTGDIRPANANGSNSDNDIDLGDASARFKDLYLSGGVFLGGTGTANKLDDYEEGTWTPADIGGGTLTVLDSRYTKIGRLVHLTSYIQFTGIGSSGSTVQLNGLPFAVITNSGQVVGNVMCNLVTRNVAAFNAATYMSSTTIKFYQSCDNSGWQPFRHVANISVNDIIYFNATYFTDA